MQHRFSSNPIISKGDLKPSFPDWVIECVLNPGAFKFNGKIWLLLRIAERPKQTKGFVSFPIYTKDGDIQVIKFQEDDPDLNLSDPRVIKYRNKTYLSTISHLRLVCSDDGIQFKEPKDLPSAIHGTGDFETYGIEDCRVAEINGTFHLTYTQVSEKGVGVGLMITKDWKKFHRIGMILPPHNKDCALFEEKIDDQYFCFHRPSGIGLGGNFIWLASSPDLIHWGNHKCLIETRPGMWDSERVGAGAAPIKTPEGWLAIYHGADENHRYCLGVILLDLNDPTKIIARSNEPIMEPVEEYEKNGFFGNVIFTNGHIIDGDQITMYYGASDEVICGARFSINSILSQLLPIKTFT